MGEETSNDLGETTRERDTSRSSGAWLLTVVHAPGAHGIGRTYRLAEPRVWLERSPRPDRHALVIPDPAISKNKVSLHRMDGGFEIRDAGSTNPVRVNGEVVYRARLAHNDVVRLGDSMLVVELDDPARSVGARALEASEALATLAEPMRLHTSTASRRLVVDASLFDGAVRAAAIWSPGPRAERHMAAWLARRWALELYAVSADQPDALERMRSAPEGSALFVRRVDLAPPERQRALVDALRAWSAGGRRPFSFSASHAARAAGAVAAHDLLAITRSSEFWVPPVSTRRADILPALEVEVQARGVAMPLLSPSLAESLLCHPWLFDLAELEMVASRVCAALARGDRLADVLAPNNDVPAVAEAGFSAELVRDAMDAFDGNMSAIAKHLGYSRAHLYRLLKREGIDPTELRQAWRRRKAASNP